MITNAHKITEKSLEEVFYEETKRAIDIVASVTMLAVFLPVMMATAAMIALTSKGSAIYAQKRLTKGGKIFYIYKFRTMAYDAEKHTGAVLAQDADPRVTKLGRFLRVTRLDELPQLINVVIGDMSLIGPRPERPEIAIEAAKKIPGFHNRLSVRAGITGLAQVSSGYASNIHGLSRKLRLDNIYIRNRSIKLDIYIAYRTVKVMISKAGR